jgi:hypothetical protein
MKEINTKQKINIPTKIIHIEEEEEEQTPSVPPSPSPSIISEVCQTDSISYQSFI